MTNLTPEQIIFLIDIKIDYNKGLQEVAVGMYQQSKYIAIIEELEHLKRVFKFVLDIEELDL